METYDMKAALLLVVVGGYVICFAHCLGIGLGLVLFGCIVAWLHLTSGGVFFG
jgi:hypothetical protein